jgi:putative ABC transport system ATP-binding protein
MNNLHFGKASFAIIIHKQESEDEDMDIVKMEHVTKIYGEGDTRVWGLDDVNLTVKKGEVVAVVGASGSGKSTLLHVMGGVDVPNSGRIVIDDKDITKLNDEEMSVFRRRKIGFVFQAYHLIPVLTVEENIQMPILLDHRKPDKEYIEHIMDMLGLADRRKHLPNQLSGGQQQRAAIARALANRPSLILADEPTGALDSKNGNEVITLLQNSVKQLNQTLVLITHNIDLAREADRIVKIADGKLVEE